MSCEDTLERRETGDGCLLFLRPSYLHTRGREVLSCGTVEWSAECGAAEMCVQRLKGDSEATSV